MNDNTTLFFMMVCMILLRAYAKNTDRRKRIAVVTAGFVALHVIQSLLFRPKPTATGQQHQNLLYPNKSPNHQVTYNPNYLKSVDAALVIFYNLFIPHGDDGASNAINVIKDQMTQVSAALSRLEMLGGHDRKRKEKGVLYYNLIGNEAAFPPNKMRDLCHQLHARLDCIQLHHYENATESVTLTSLHDFCHSDHVLQSNENTTRVVYLHSKGSYHDHGKQAPWRREMTNSSLYPHCLRPPDDQCDVCGAQYYTMFASMFPGNMWTAKCSYIRKLLPPVTGGEYERRKEAAIKQFLLLRAEGVLQNRVGWHQDVFYGLDRYIWEHWVGSHPSIRPCEVHKTYTAFWDMMVEGKVNETNNYEWGMGPRREMMFDKPGEGNRAATSKKKDVENDFRQYYYLAGNMVKWLALYDTVPTQDSWVWNHFPAGEKWKEHVGIHGKDSITALIEGSKSEYHSAFASNHSESTISSWKKLPDEENEALSSQSINPPLVVFYQISIPPDGNNKDKALEAVKAQFDVLSMGQYDNRTNSFDNQRKIFLYYIISGGGSSHESTMSVVSDLCTKYFADKIICRPLSNKAYDTDISGETMRRLHSFCSTAKPLTNVVYITNQLVGFDGGGVNKNSYDATKIQVATSAVMSKMCRLSKDGCNVCGTEFYPLPFSHFTGNMFSASCTYVKDLLPPPTFEKEMYNIAGDAVLAHLRKQFTSELFQFTPQILGLHQYSIGHWIGSHPDLKPCDVAPTKTGKLDGTILNQMKQYSWSLAPRRGSAPAGHLDGEKESNFRSKREVAFREYYYLAGNTFRWHRLYNKMPAESSWVWQWFPDGELYRTASKKSGVDAVDVIAKQLSSASGMDQFWVE